MDKSNEHILNLTEKLDHLKGSVHSLEDDIREKVDENEVKVIIDEQLKMNNVMTKDQVALIVDKILTEKKYMTESEVNNITKEIHLKILKWTIGTGLSVAAIILALLRVIL